MKFSKFIEEAPGNFMLITWFNRNLKVYLLAVEFKKSCIQNSQQLATQTDSLCQIDISMNLSLSGWSGLKRKQINQSWKTVSVNPACQ